MSDSMTTDDLRAAIARVRYWLDDKPPYDEIRMLADAAAERAAGQHSVDCIGIALELEDRARKVESQTTERAMLRGAQALRMLAAEGNQ